MVKNWQWCCLAALNHRDETRCYLFRIVNRNHWLSTWWLWWSSMTSPFSPRIHVKTSTISTLKYLVLDLFVIGISALDYLHPSPLVGLTVSQGSCRRTAEAPSAPAAPQQQCGRFSCLSVLFSVICFSCSAFGPPSRSWPGPGARPGPGYVQFCTP